MSILPVPAAEGRAPALAQPARDRARRLKLRLTLKRTSAMISVFGMLGVGAVTTYIAWNERRVLFQEAHDHAGQSAAYLADHALRLFEVSDLALHATEATLGTKGWDASGADPSTTAVMRRTVDMLPYVDVLFGADAAGVVRLVTLDTPAGYSVADRSVFLEARANPTDQLLIGEPIVGRVTKKPTFLVARRRNGPDGRFDGIVGAAMTLAYFTDYWPKLDKRNDERIALVRLGSGSVLARFPAATDAEDDARLGSSLVAAAAASNEAAGRFRPGPHDFGSFRRVGDLPLAVAVVFRDAAITRQWHALLARLLPLAGAAILALFGALGLAHRLARREELARRQIETARAVLSAANTRLELRVAERTAELVESNREIQRFAYIVSHDLRAPLVNIMGFTSELRELRDVALDDPARLDEATRVRLHADFDEAFGFIGSSIDKMDRLIKAILALSRQGQRVFRPEPLDMDAVMRSIVDGVAHQVQQKGASVVVHPLPGLLADRIAVEQVFANLIDNGVKYLRPGVPGVIEITGTASSTTVTYAVKDNGRGIDPKDQERVFELFRRAGPQDQAGEGIGLANVRSLVRRLQGTITLDSALGMGCVFAVTLPLAADATGAE